MVMQLLGSWGKSAPDGGTKLGGIRGHLRRPSAQKLGTKTNAADPGPHHGGLFCSAAARFPAGAGEAQVEAGSPPLRLNGGPAAAAGSVDPTEEREGALFT